MGRSDWSWRTFVIVVVCAAAVALTAVVAGVAVGSGLQRWWQEPSPAVPCQVIDTDVVPRSSPAGADAVGCQPAPSERTGWHEH